jgi:hypothetical protein
MFQFPAFASDPLWIQEPDTLILQRKTEDPGGSLPQGLETPVAEGGFPHSEIPGSKPVRGSPGLIAAYHVLHRLSAPRHPPDALLSLDRSHCRCPRKRASVWRENPSANREKRFVAKGSPHSLARQARAFCSPGRPSTTIPSRHQAPNSAGAGGL